MDVLPIRAYWVMTRKWRCDERESLNAIGHFVEKYDRPRYYGLSKQAITKSFELAEKLKHDVYNCAYLAAAMQEKASAIITTDTDFEGLCKHVGIEYLNPIPNRGVETLQRMGKPQ